MVKCYLHYFQYLLDFDSYLSAFQVATCSYAHNKIFIINLPSFFHILRFTITLRKKIVCHQHVCLLALIRHQAESWVTHLSSVRCVVKVENIIYLCSKGSNHVLLWADIHKVLQEAYCKPLIV